MVVGVMSCETAVIRPHPCRQSCIACAARARFQRSAGRDGKTFEEKRQPQRFGQAFNLPGPERRIGGNPMVKMEDNDRCHQSQPNLGQSVQQHGRVESAAHQRHITARVRPAGQNLDERFGGKIQASRRCAQLRN
jgi:hypothetical protein